MRKITLQRFINNFIRVALVLLVGFTVFTIINLQQNNKDILNHVKSQQDQSDQAVKQLKEDNAQQTVILCTLILSQKVTGDDIPKIEAICKEKIKQNDVSISDAAISQALQVPQASTGSEPQPTTTSNPTPAQAAPEQPTPPVTIPTPVGTISVCLPFTNVCIRS